MFVVCGVALWWVLTLTGVRERESVCMCGLGPGNPASLAGKDTTRKAPGCGWQGAQQVVCGGFSEAYQTLPHGSNSGSAGHAQHANLGHVTHTISSNMPQQLINIAKTTDQQQHHGSMPHNTPTASTATHTHQPRMRTPVCHTPACVRPPSNAASGRPGSSSQPPYPQLHSCCTCRPLGTRPSSRHIP